MHDDSNDGPNPSGYCMCGCGERTPLATRRSTLRGSVAGKPARYVNSGHASKQRGAARRHDGPNPSGLCMCGCGLVTPLAKQTDASKDTVKDQPMKFLFGHHRRGATFTPEQRAQIAQTLRARVKLGALRFDRRRAKVYVGIEHPMAGKDGYVFRYRLVAADAVGRMLTPAEHVHHIDLDETNDAPGNLALLDSSKHKRLHLMLKAGSDPLDALARVGGCPLTAPIRCLLP